MTPQERQLIDDLFDRLTKLESTPRDTEAERAISDGLRRAPNALYPLVQTVLVQDEALKRADARIRELSGEEPEQPSGGFLDSMRAMLGGRSTSVPAVRAAGPDPRWNSGTQPQGSDPRWGSAQTQASPFSGGSSSFLGTAAATAAGVIGGALLMNSFRSMFGDHQNAMYDAPSASPWNSDAATDADTRDKFRGINDIGGNDRQGLFDNSASNNDHSDDVDYAGGDDFGGGDGGSDSA